MRFAFGEAQKARFAVSSLCRVLGESRSGYSAWRGGLALRRALENKALRARVVDIHQRMRGAYGRSRIRAEWRNDAVATGRNRVARIMCVYELFARRKRQFRQTTDVSHPIGIAPNVHDRDFSVPAPNRASVTDIAYVSSQKGWLNLATMLDLFSRRVVA